MMETLKGLFNPDRSLPLFLLGTATVTLLLQGIYDYANEPGVWKGGYWLALLMLLMTIGVLIRAWRKRSGRVDIREKQVPRPRRGLILLAGPQKRSNPAALDHHLNRLEHCWIIATPESVGTATALFQEYGNRLEIHYGSGYIVDAEEFAPTYDVVMRILSKEMQEAGLGVTEMIADITGGTKPMTSGMALACVACHIPMQYIKTNRGVDGQVSGDSWGIPIQVDASFITLREGDGNARL